MLGTTAEHPLRRLRALVISLPLLRRLWRALFGSAEPVWMDVSRYAKEGGVFAPVQVKAQLDQQAAPPLHQAEQYYPDLLARIDASVWSEPAPSDPVCIINNGLSGGGAERQIVYTLTGLAARGRNVRFIGEYLDLAPGQSFYLPQLRSAGVPAAQMERHTRPPLETYRHVPRAVAEALSRMPTQDVLDILDMADHLRSIRPALVHIWQDQSATKHTISALLAGVPRTILSFRNLNPTHFEFHLPHMRAAYRAFAAHPAVRLSNNSQAGANSYASWLGLPATQITVIRNAVDMDAWPERSRTEAESWRTNNGFSAVGPLVIGIFRLSPEKRPLLWLETAAEIRARTPAVQFGLIGIGNMKDAVDEAIVRLGLSGCVRCLGEIRDVSLPLKAADAFLLTSAQEGMPNVLLEAQWYGCPVVTTDAGGAREAVLEGPAGIVAETDSPCVLAELVTAVINQDSKAQNPERDNRELIRKRFGLDRMLDETIAVYEVH
jgi:glycosyltransferase involved in cell wall biosynthesis